MQVLVAPRPLRHAAGFPTPHVEAIRRTNGTCEREAEPGTGTGTGTTGGFSFFLLPEHIDDPESE